MANTVSAFPIICTFHLMGEVKTSAYTGLFTEVTGCRQHLIIWGLLYIRLQSSNASPQICAELSCAGKCKSRLQVDLPLIKVILLP